MAGNSPRPIENPDLSWFKSIEGLFDLVTNSIGQVDVLMVGFDPALHFPNQIQLDPYAQFVDDEESYLLSDVKPIE